MPTIAGSQRVALLAIAAIAPAGLLVFGVEPAIAVTLGVLVAGCLAALALRPGWDAAAWAALATGGVWALVGFATGDLVENLDLAAAALLTTGAMGCVFAFKQDLIRGAALTSMMAIAALALASGPAGVISSAGAAYGGLVLLAAATGAASLRLEALNVGAFLATLVGLFVLSGQPAAAVWFTPVSAWAGAVFLAIAVVRVPALGPRGMTLAGAGALAPYAVITALSFARHGLSDRLAAGGAYLLLAAIVAGIIVLSARRRESRLAGLGMTLWILGIAAAVSLCSALVTALPSPAAAAALSAVAVGLVYLDRSWEHAVWRALACAFGLLAALYAAANARLVLSEAVDWPGWAIVAFGVATPAALAGVAAWRAQWAKAPVTAGLFEFLCIVLGLVAADLLVRLIFTGGATRLRPLDFVEAGAHIAVWLAASLLVALNARGTAASARLGASAAIGATAAGAALLSALLWLSPYWTARNNVLGAAAPLGFLLPALLLGAHWVFWRARGSRARTRLALAWCTVLLAAFVTLEVSSADGVPDWLAALAGAFSFASAIVVNFAPGVVLDDSRRGWRTTRRQG